MSGKNFQGWPVSYLVKREGESLDVDQSPPGLRYLIVWRVQFERSIHTNSGKTITDIFNVLYFTSSMSCNWILLSSVFNFCPSMLFNVSFKSLILFEKSWSFDLLSSLSFFLRFKFARASCVRRAKSCKSFFWTWTWNARFALQD